MTTESLNFIMNNADNSDLSVYAVVVEWQTRTLEGRMGDRVGSSPTDRTKRDILTRVSLSILRGNHYVKRTTLD